MPGGGPRYFHQRDGPGGGLLHRHGRPRDRRSGRPRDAGGGKKGQRHHHLPEAVLVEIKEQRIPTSYANAFLKPVVPPAEDDLLTESVRRFGHYVGLVGAGYGLSPQRFWFNLH